ncbi:60s ribosomal protein l10a-3 [Quercus suber]|uniref:60s ribosomal protein l10a-3 n=1 Tax=Quercus suber TaxID=58331 RepID=A0AAW0M4R7_QUESU
MRKLIPLFCPRSLSVPPPKTLLFRCIAMSKLQSDTLREVISQVVNNAKEKKRNFTETIELQIGLKNYA